LPLERLRARIEQRLPVELGRGGQSVGRLGRLSYSVRRDAVALRLEGGKLLVDVSITGQASVCLPLGSFCPPVSGCSPALIVTAAIPLALGADHRFGSSAVSTRVTRGCVIAGVDATARLASAAAQQAEAAGRRIDQELPSLRPEIEALWALLGQPAPLAGGPCLLATPGRLVQAPPSIADGSLLLHVGLGVTLRRSAACPPTVSPAQPPPLPAPESVAALDPVSDLALVSERPWPEVASALERLVGLDTAATGLASPAGTGEESRPAGLAPLSVAETRAVASAPSPLVASRIVLGGEHCGEVWLGAVPRVARREHRVVLAAPDLLAGQPGRAAALAGLPLGAWLQGRARIDVGPAVGPGVVEAIRQRIEQAARRRATGTKVTATEVTSSLDRALASADGLVSIERARARLVVDIE
jgi:hypothetical protein